ncbi:MAG TPA: hypothetical protein VFR49_13450, partial [Solirubrobacteraceae bacterium]|nr:hypothetical protein [Solirubrobacteraceae bacterium]
ADAQNGAHGAGLLRPAGHHRSRPRRRTTTSLPARSSVGATARRGTRTVAPTEERAGSRIVLLEREAR